ncbi:MAG: sigma factor-like helix-turn-helix DNA-binding protein, partial [Actinomycetota bacterium]|nr:sigma factor-like helix-turn-helix DNA-binding protein [Actinomycetota bacterium]
MSVRSRLESAGVPVSQPESDLRLADMLEPLRPAERLAVYLRVIEDRPFAEVAHITGKSEDAAKKTVYRALSRLRSIQEESRVACTRERGT